MPKEIRTCSCCGGKIVEYKHGLNRTMAKILQVGWIQGRREWRMPFNVSSNEAFTFSQRANFQKLRYWGLVQKEAEEGLWRVTEEGENWLRGRNKQKAQVYTFRGERRPEPPLAEIRMVSIYDLDPDWDLPRRSLYAKQAVPARDDRQQSLL